MLIDQFEGDAGPAIPLIADGTLELAADATLDLPHVPRWHCGPLIVIGDAAHAATPASGQGASLAIEDGVLLAKYLRQLPTAPAFAAFERRAAAGSSALSRRAPGQPSPHAGPARPRVRDLTLPVVFRYLMTERSLRVDVRPSRGLAPAGCECLK